MDCDILVIGAGAAGIAAARAARAAGRSVHLLEARPRLGGRALTDAESLGAPFDLGATWMHDAEHNPLVALARTVGVALRDADSLRNEISFVGGRRANAAELAEYDAAWARFERVIAERAARGPDIAVSAAIPRGGPWDATVAAWQGEVIAAWSFEEMSLRDFAATLLGGSNLLPEGGFGALVARLGADLPVTTSARVERLRWGGAQAVAEGSFGTLRAGAVICTLPTPLLAAEAIRFDPPLPPEVLQAAHDLPLGHAIKLGLRAAGADRLGLPPHASTDRQVRPGETLIPITFWPNGADHAMAWIGGPLALQLEREGPAAAEALVREELATRLGSRAPAAFRPGALVSGWGADPLSRGVYTHARLGGAGARAVLATPLAGGRLCFAGEACHPTLAATVAGAWLSGEAALASVVGHSVIGQRA